MPSKPRNRTARAVGKKPLQAFDINGRAVLLRELTDHEKNEGQCEDCDVPPKYKIFEIGGEAESWVWCGTCRGHEVLSYRND